MQLTSAPRRRQKYTRFRFGLATIAIVVAPCIAPRRRLGPPRGAPGAVEIEADADDGARDDDGSEAASGGGGEGEDERKRKSTSKTKRWRGGRDGAASRRSP